MSEDGWPHNQPGLKVASRLPAEGRTAACHLINRPLKFRIGVWYKTLRVAGTRPEEGESWKPCGGNAVGFREPGGFCRFRSSRKSLDVYRKWVARYIIAGDRDR